MSKLLCTKSMAAHWGIIFEYGKYYDYTICEKEVTFITNYNDWDNYLVEIVQNGFEIIKLRNKGTDVTWLAKKNKVLEKKKKECLKTLTLQHVMIKSDDRDTVYYFLTTTDEELYQLGADKSKIGRPCFKHTTDRVDDYFDYKSEIRDNKLNELLK